MIHAKPLEQCPPLRLRHISPAVVIGILINLINSFFTFVQHKLTGKYVA